MHYNYEWEKYYGKYDITQDANAAREKMMLELSMEEKISIMFDDFLRSKEDYHVINLAKRHCEEV